MKKLGAYFISFLSSIIIVDALSQQKPALIGQGDLIYPPSELYVIYDQMDNPGTNSIISQNFETSLDNYDSFAADDFALMDMTWHIESIDVLGVYNNGNGPANSVNVWIYNSNGFGGLPIDIIYSALNIIPSAGLATGSFSIPLPVTAVLNEGWYWLCVQANMDFANGGQWLWTERTFQSFSESAWQNPGGGFGTPCTPSWGYRVTNCGVGTQPDNCFRFNGFVTPVELSSFTAAVNSNEVVLNWSTATETNNSGFSIERKYANSEYSEVGFVPGFGTTAEPKYYSFTDAKRLAGKYNYRLKQIDFGGSFKYSSEVEVDVTAPLTFYLEQNYPNPFNPTTTIKYGIPERTFVELKVYDVLGKEIASLVNEEKPSGSYEVEFIANNLPSGIYFYTLSTGNFFSTKKMVLLK